VFEWLERFITDVIGQYGYLAVFVLMVLESALIPIPSEITMVFGGFLVSRGQLDLFWTGLLGSLANVLGSWLAYWLGRYGGRPLAERWGRYVFIRKHELDRAERWFAEHGEAAAFFSRLIPVVRTFISLPAGVAGMPFRKFTLYTFLGCLPWTFGLTAAGYLLGEQWHLVERYGEPASVVIAITLAGLIGWWLWRRARSGGTDEGADPFASKGPDHG
jgi:membrane protein DedA with SNARE-associated domain